MPLLTSANVPRAIRAPFVIEQRLLYRFVVLSLLLHALVVAIFGTAPGGGARRGDGALGALDVTLRRLTPEPGAGIRLAPGAESTAPGTALVKRLGNATAPPAEPRADSLLPAPGPIAPATPLAPPVQGDIRDDAPTGLSPLREALPALDRSAPDEVDKPIAPPRAPPPKIERMPVPLSEPVVREIPPPAPPVERISPPLVEREIAPAVEPPSRELPFPVPPAPVEPPPPVVREVMPAVEPIVAPPIDIPPRKAPPETSASPERAVPGVEREAPPPAAPLPRSAPADVAPRADRVVPPAAVAPRVDPVAPPAAAPVSAAPPAPARTESPAVPPPPRLRFGAPGPGEEITEPRGDAVAPAPEPRVAPRIDLDATRQRAREITSDGGSYRGAVPIMAPPPPPVDRKSKLSEAIEKALKPDCRDAYASMGLLAVPALVASAGGNGGCRW